MANHAITIYQKPTCSTCREALKIIKAHTDDFQAINYYEEPFSKSKLKALIRKAGLQPKDVVRTKEDVYKRLDLRKNPRTDDELIELMVQYPDLIQRPLVETKKVAILARPAETVKTVLR